MAISCCWPAIFRGRSNTAMRWWICDGSASSRAAKCSLKAITTTGGMRRASGAPSFRRAWISSKPAPLSMKDGCCAARGPGSRPNTRPSTPQPTSASTGASWAAWSVPWRLPKLWRGASGRSVYCCTILRFCPPARRRVLPELISAAGAAFCVYGHLHRRADWNVAVQGRRDGVRYHLTACDYLGFVPSLIVDEHGVRAGQPET